MRLVHWLVVVSLFTASCDVILNFSVGGSLRLCQILMMVVCVAALAKPIQEGRVLWARGSNALVLWMVVQAMLIPLSGVMSIGLTFYALLLFTVITVFAVTEMYGDSPLIGSLMKMYLLSYVFVGSFGLVQFALPLAGLPSPLVIQWIVHGRVARINGFSYEPSYYATYMIMGWIMLVDLRVSKARITEGRWWKRATVLVTAALFLSSSKTAWIFMLVELAARTAPGLWRIVRRFVREVREGRIMLYVRKGAVRNLLIACVMAVVVAKGVSSLLKNPLILLSGTGLMHQPAHSINGRSAAASQTIDAFLEHPFVGRSLGGVSIYIASRDGIEVKTMEEVRKFWGFPVLMDVLVASGVFGFLPFLAFMYANTVGVMRLAHRRWPEERAKWVRALGRAMIFEWMLLMTDQNLLRVYLWFHIAVVAAVAYHLECSPAPGTVAAQPQLQAGGLGEAAAAL